jgi:uncharacterized protein YegP (UPF0339 family)
MYKTLVYPDRSGQWRWNMKAANGAVVADSSEGYERAAGAERGFEAACLILEGYDHIGSVEVYEDMGGRWRWRAVAKNGRTVADCGGSYSRRSSVRRALGRLVDQLSFVQVVITLEAP